MGFQHTWLLLLTPIPVILLMAWLWRRRGGNVVLPFDHSDSRDGRWMRWIINCAQTLPILLFAVVLLILANPVKLGEPEEKRVLTNIEFCVDISGSMTASFGDGSRYDGSMAAINEFLDYREGDAFGLTFFGNNVLHWTPLTSDPSAIRCAPPFMRPENAPYWFGGTEIAKALQACRRVLTTREEGDRMIILVSDGYSFDLGNGNEMAVAEQLKDAYIVLYAVHIADSEMPGEIATIASITGGEVFEPGDPTGLSMVFQRIDEMQETRMEKTSSETLDNYRPYCLAGLILLGLVATAQFGLRYTPW